jgi:PPOX class probable F420-dependent enzyme
MNLTTALDHLGRSGRGVLTTQKSDGRPQLSNISYGMGDDLIVRISITAGRAKYANLRRDPRASLHVTRDDFYAYVVVEGDVTLSAVASDPHDAASDELVALYRSIAGEHDNWDEYRAAMVKDRRVVVRLDPNHAYGMWSD